jgi:hypothetical protein
MSRPSNTASYLLAAVILGIGVLTALLTLSLPGHFGAEGGDPARTAGFAAGVIVLTVSMFLVKRHTPLDGEPGTDDDP